MSLERPTGLATRRGSGLHYGLVSLLLAVLTVTAALGLGRFAYSMILPGMQNGLGLTHTQTGLLATANFVGYLIAAFGGGILASQFGPRRVIGVASAGVGATMIATGFAPSFEWALLWRFLTGLSSASCVVSATGLLVAWFRPRRRGLATGGATGGSGVGLVLSGALVPAIAVAHAPDGWRFAWFYLGGIALAVCIVDWLFIRNTPAEMGLEPFGPAEPASAQANGGEVADLAAVYKAPALWYLGCTFAIWGFSYIIFATFFAAYLVGERGYDATFVGTLWATAGAISIVSGILWGMVSDAIGRGRGLAGVLLLQTVCFFAYTRVDSAAGLWAATFLYGLTAWSVPGIMQAAAGDVAGPRLAAAAVGFITLIFGIGQAIGPGVAGAVADMTGSFAPAFLLASGGAGLSGLLALAFGLRRRANP